MKLVPFEWEHINHMEFGEFEKPHLSGKLFSGPEVFGITAIENGKPIGSGGVIVDTENKLSGWMILSDEARKKPFLLYRTAKKVFQKVKQETGEKVYATIAKDNKTMLEFAERIGMTPTGREFKYESLYLIEVVG